MNNWMKVLIGVGVTGVVAATTYVVYKKNEEKKQSKDISEQPQEVANVDESVIEKIKTAAAKKALRIAGWLVLHESQVRAVGAAISVVSAIFSVVNAAKEYALGKKLHQKLAELTAFQDEVRGAWNGTVEAYDKNWDMTLKKLQDIHLDIPHDGQAS